MWQLQPSLVAAGVVLAKALPASSFTASAKLPFAACVGQQAAQLKPPLLALRAAGEEAGGRSQLRAVAEGSVGHAKCDAPLQPQAHDALDRRRFFQLAVVAAGAATVGGRQAAAQTFAGKTAAAPGAVRLAGAAAGAAATAAAAPAETGLQSFVSGAASGVVVRIAKQVVLHPVETVKTRLQYSAEARQLRPELFKGVYDGLLPPLVVGVPAGAVFFAIKDYLQTVARNAAGDGFGDLATVAAVGLANVPYWGILTPAEVLKTRQQAGLGDPNAVSAAAEVLRNEGPGGLYVGYGSNLAYAFPADAIKFLVYENLKRNALAGRKGVGLAGLKKPKLSPAESATLGAAASVLAQAVSTPLDVARTRLMTQARRSKPGNKAGAPAAAGEGSPVRAASYSSGEEAQEGATKKGAAAAAAAQREAPPYKYSGVWNALETIAAEEGPGALSAGLAPRLARAVLSGAIQFASYEFTKGLFPAGMK